MRRDSEYRHELRVHRVKLDDLKNLKEARNAGDRYYKGKACPKGHIGERYVLNGGCIDCSAALKRKWRRRNEPPNTSKAIAIDHLKDKVPDYYDDLL